VEGRFLYGCCDLAQLRPEDVPPDWVEQLPEGYVRDAARQLLAESRSETPCVAAAATLREFARIWEEAGR
jgi:hypothetical protein